MVTTIEESKDLTKLTMDDVSGSLLANEVRLLRQANNQADKEEKVFHVRGEASRVKDRERAPFRGRGRSFSRKRFHGKGRGRAIDNHQLQGEQRSYKLRECPMPFM